MQMHQQKSEQQQQQIGGQSSDICISADLSTPQNTNQKQTHLHIQIPQTQTELNHETLLSTPHKRPIMIQTTSHSPAFSSHTNHHKKSSNLESSSHSLSCCSFARKLFAHKFVQNVYRVCFLRFHLRFLILLPLPSLYFFFTNAHRFLVLNFLFVLAFVVTLLLLSLNLALPRLPSLRSLLSRSLPINLTPLLSTSSSVNPLKPVVWSIGSKPKLAKNPNSGSWVYVYNNGDVYEGEFHRGKSSGSGVYYYFKKGRYEGDWIDGKYDGYGVETWARGSRYRGIFRQGLRHGIGLYRSYTGDIYAGEWSNGQCHGCGVHTCEDGSRYIGEFKWGVKHGLGYYQFRNGDVYSGEYFADRMHGFGVYQFANGHRYEGAWHEGRRQGLGMYTFRNGETQSGHWQNGVLDVSSLQNSDSAHPFAVSHSKVLNAVQEAQRAAARAYDVARVDERVNKAMVAANKAANAARVAAVKAVQNQMHQNNNDDVQIPIV